MTTKNSVYKIDFRKYINKTLWLKYDNDYKGYQQKMNMKKGIVLTIILFGLLILPVVCALTATISNPRMVLYQNISSGETLEFQNSVIAVNDNDFEVKVNVAPSETLEGIVTVNEPESILQKGERKEIFYDITINEAGAYVGDILVTFSEEGANKEVSLVQELEVYVVEDSSSSNKNANIAFFGVVLFIILIGTLFIIKSKEKKK